MTIMDSPRPTHEAKRRKLQNDIKEYLKAGGSISLMPNTLGKISRNSWRDNNKQDYKLRLGKIVEKNQN